MKKILLPPSYFSFLVFSLFLALYFLYFEKASNFTIESHSLEIDEKRLVLLTLLFLFLLLSLWLLFSFFLSRIYSLRYSSSLFLDFLSYLPFFFIALLPLAAGHYLSASDLQLRLRLFAIGLGFSFLYLKFILILQQEKQKPRLLILFLESFLALSLKKKIIILFFLALILYNSGSYFLTLKGINFSGDEPHYLLITHSLMKDGDFDLSNNYRNKDYTLFMKPGIEIQPHVAPGTGGRYSFHSPGTSFFLLPFYALGQLFAGKFLILFLRFGMSIFGALLGIQIFLFSLEEWRREKLSLALWLLSSLTSPVYFYSLHVYPEIIIALFSLFIFRTIRFSKKFPKLKLILLGSTLSSFLWFHAIKYVFLMVPLLLYGLFVVSRKQHLRWEISYFLGPFFLLFALYFFFQHSLYSSFSPSSVTWRGAIEPQESLSYLRSILTEIPFRVRWETLAGYFFDQKDGLLFYSPLYFFSFLGMIEMARRKFRDFATLFFLTAPYVLNSAFLTQRTGYAPQARPLVSVSWGLAIFLGYFLAECKKKIFHSSLVFSSFLSFVFLILLLVNPLSLYQLTTRGEIERSGKLFLHLSNLHFYLPQYLPSYLKIDNSGWIPNYVWLGIFLFLIVLYLAMKKHTFTLGLKSQFTLLFLGFLVFYFIAVLYPRPVLLYPTKTSFPSGEKITFYAIGKVAKMREPGKFYLPEDRRPYIFYFTSWRKIEAFEIVFGSQDGEFFAEIAHFDSQIFKGNIRHKINSLRLSPAYSYRLKNTNLYRVSIYLEKKSGLLDIERPFFFFILPVRSQS